MEDMRNSCQVLFVKPQGKRYVEELGEDDRIIIK
jgi:hypothetical protein